MRAGAPYSSSVLVWRVQMRTPQGPALLWQGYREPAAWIALVWSALGPGALAAYLQTQVLKARCKAPHKEDL